MPAAVHPNALHALNANDLNAYIVVAIAVFSKVDQFLRGVIEWYAMASDFADILSVDGIVKPIGAE